MNFTLSSTLLNELKNQSGVYAYAFAFNAGGSLISSTTLISNGVVQPQANFSFALTNSTNPTVNGGNVVIALQQLPTGLTPLINNVSAIGDVLNTANATTENYRYDAIEFTLLGQATDAADLTNVVQFGSTMQLSVPYSNAPTQTRSYNVTGNALVSELVNTLSPPNSQNYPWSPASPLTGQREVLGLANNVSPNPLNQPSNWTTYVTGFEALASGTSSPVYIANYFNGAGGSSGGPASLCYFQVQYDSTTNAGQGGTFWLVPVDLSGVNVAQTPYTIGITANELESNIVAQTGQLSVYTAARGNLVQTYTSFTPNNAYGDVAKYFVAGFDAGFFGGAAKSINPDDPSNYSLSQTWNWSAPYAYEANGLNYGYTNSIGTGSGYYDPFANYFFQNTNAYGYSYSDLISNGGGVNPLVSLWDSGTNANVGNINVTLYDYSDTPSGYTAPQLNYVPAAVQNSDTLAPGLELLFDLSLNGGAAAPVNGTPITFRVYAPNDPSHDAQGFINFALPDSGGGAYNYYYQLTGSSGSWNALNPTNPGGQAGFFAINGIPVVQPGTSNWGWYQLVLGQAGQPGYKAFNLYVQTDGTNITNALVDGGAAAQVITTAAGQAKFAMVSGGNITYDPQWWTSSSPATAVPPQNLPAPLVGNIATDDSFVPFLDVSKVDRGEAAFSWSPASSGANRVVGGYYVKLNLANRDHSDWIMMPLVTQSPIDGDWKTALSAQFGNGDYSAFMSQYKLKDPGLTTPVVASTVESDFTVKLDRLTLVTADAGTALGLDPGSSTTKGNWIQLQAVHSSLPNGTLLAYATDANDKLVDRTDGHTGPDVTLEKAVIGHLGLVNDDHGGLMFAGDEEVYLPTGEHLHFALEDGNNALQVLPTTQVSGSSGALNVSVGGSAGLLQMVAAVNNDLSANDALAAAQRTSDRPWVYLTQGSTIDVEAAGSAFYVNTLHFVRIAVDPNSGAWSVGGVAYGNTDAFRAAVQQNWDQGFTLTDGHGTFDDHQSWTVAGKDGFYAPVLSTQAGDTFVLGTANVDGRDHLRAFGANIFGFEDTPAFRNSDFDYNDMVVKLTVNSGR
ncbi:MAG: hypothetical protein JO339_29575 [Alphaproteobacteria bacterium]|nr:hypothetical protein [Alphaproteobacteria bacterium]